MKLCHFFTLICERNRPEYIDFLRCFCYIRDILMFICQTNMFKCVNMFDWRLLVCFLQDSIVFS